MTEDDPVTCPGCGKTLPEGEWEADVLTIRLPGLNMVDIGFRCDCGDVWGHDLG